jgi:hypothetical protein
MRILRGITVNLFNSLLGVGLPTALCAFTYSAGGAESPKTRPLAPNDITILFPLPKSDEEFSKAIKIADRLPVAAFPRGNYNLAHGAREQYSPETVVASTVLIGLRLDPCFKSLPTDACDPQVRGVWQPVVKADDGTGYTTLDATAHSFHPVSRAELDGVLNALTAHRVGTKSLSVHTRLAQEGYSGPTYQALISAIRPFVRADRTKKVASMTFLSDVAEWNFEQFEKEAGTGSWKNAPVKRSAGSSDGLTQRFVNWGQQTEFLTETSAAALSETALWFPLVNSVYFRGYAKPAEVQAAFKLSRSILTTTDRKPGTMDCVSCHASFALEAILAKDLGEKSVSHKQEIRTRSLRAFGYFGKEPRISPRVLTETRESLKILNQGNKKPLMNLFTKGFFH